MDDKEKLQIAILVAENLSMILHKLEKRGISLTNEEDEEWGRQTLTLEKIKS